MSESCTQGAAARQPGAAVACGRFRKNLRMVDVLAPLWEKIWPVSTAAEVAFRTGDSLRAAEYQLAKTFDLSGAAFANLIASDAGPDHLKALMDARRAAGLSVPVWFADYLRQQKLSQLSKSLARISEDRARLEREFALRD